MASTGTTVEFPERVVAEIDALVGADHRADFLAALAEREIKRQRLLGVLQEGRVRYEMGLLRVG